LYNNYTRDLVIPARFLRNIKYISIPPTNEFVGLLERILMRKRCHGYKIKD